MGSIWGRLIVSVFSGKSYILYESKMPPSIDTGETEKKVVSTAEELPVNSPPLHEISQLEKEEQDTQIDLSNTEKITNQIQENLSVLTPNTDKMIAEDRIKVDEIPVQDKVKVDESPVLRTDDIPAQEDLKADEIPTQDILKADEMQAQV